MNLRYMLYSIILSNIFYNFERNGNFSAVHILNTGRLKFEGVVEW